jgi:hypothetical protein
MYVSLYDIYFMCTFNYIFTQYMSTHIIHTDYSNKAKSDIHITDKIHNIPCNSHEMKNNENNNFENQNSVLTRIDTYNMLDMYLLEQFLFSHLPFSSKVFRLVDGSIKSKVKQVRIYIYMYISICTCICIYI